MPIADLHIHSRFSRATSKDGDLPHLDVWARRKGLNLVGTGDFTHPAWRAEMSDMLLPDAEGLYRLKPEFCLPCEFSSDAPLFVVSGEISTIYKKNGKTRKVHHVILLPSLVDAENLSHRLEAIGNLHSDGRPILGLDSHDLLEIVLESCPRAIYFPAHIWTPHFSLFGAFSGFDTLDECYGDLSPYVHALETGLSSDPAMNRLCSALDGHPLISNSDAHSPQKLGREATLLSGKLSYSALSDALRTGEGLQGTIEFFPEEGKYHLDGHRGCDCRLTPQEAQKLNGICPVCGKRLTIGVLHRVCELADRDRAEVDRPFESLIPLPEVAAECVSATVNSKKAQNLYFSLLSRYGDELSILRTLPSERAERDFGFAVGEALRRLRAGDVRRAAGFDGEYGVISLFAPGELERLAGQQSFLLADLPRKEPSTPPIPLPVQPQNASSQTLTSYSDTLTAQQTEAVQSEASVVAVVAGPGSGKTRTLVARIANLLAQKQTPPEHITAVTFTRQAAKELRSRLVCQCGYAANRLTIGTFHSVCLSLLPSRPLIARTQALTLLDDLLRAHGSATLSSSEALSLLSARKNALEAPSLPVWLPDAYQRELEKLSVRDLDDVLLEALQTDCNLPRFTHVLVDEFQDISLVQHRLVLHLAAHAKSLFVIGDPDQSIYGFRGADAACFDRLLEDRPNARLVTLEDHFRSTPQVLSAAQDALTRYDGRARVLISHRADGFPVRLVSAADTFSEGVWIAKEIARMTGGIDMLTADSRPAAAACAPRAFSDMAVLCRTHRQLDQIEACLRHDDIPCEVACAMQDDPKVQGLTGFFRSLLDSNDALSLRDALHGLFRCPMSLVQRAQVAFEKDANSAKLRASLGEFSPLLPWLDAVESLQSRMATDAPRTLLAELAQRAGVAGRAVEQLLNTGVFFDSISDLLNAMLLGQEGDVRRLSGGYASGAVRLLTLHAAKGLEFPVVFVAGVTRGVLPLEREGKVEDEGEERRLLYVGMTRAKDELILTYGGEPSPFIHDLSQSVLRQDAASWGKNGQGVQLSMF